MVNQNEHQPKDRAGNLDRCVSLGAFLRRRLVLCAFFAFVPCFWLSLTEIPSVSLLPGPTTIDDEPMNTTRSVRLISKCLTRPEVDFVVEEWLPKQDRVKTWLRVKQVSYCSLSDEMRIG